MAKCGALSYDLAWLELRDAHVCRLELPYDGAARLGEGAATLAGLLGGAEFSCATVLQQQQMQVLLLLLLLAPKLEQLSRHSNRVELRAHLRRQ